MYLSNTLGIRKSKDIFISTYQLFLFSKAIRILKTNLNLNLSSKLLRSTFPYFWYSPQNTENFLQYKITFFGEVEIKKPKILESQSQEDLTIN